MDKKDIIHKHLKTLGYTESERYYTSDQFNTLDLDYHTRKIFNEITPDATYIVNNKPFIVFYFSEKENIDYKAIWNSEIPFVFNFSQDSLIVYDGFNYLLENERLQIFKEVHLDEIESSELTYWDLTDQNNLNKYEKEMKGARLYESLLSNISFLNEKLREEYQVDFSTKLVLRIIFIRYLIDRGVVLDYRNLNSKSIDINKEGFKKIVGHKDSLYSLFEYLKKEFNGNLFETSNELNTNNLTEEVFKLLEDFVSGNVEMNSGQGTLFPLYDFNIIPIELISHIYEILLGSERQSKQKSFYTPSYLVEYTINTTPIDVNKPYKILDPACGSGIFLVKAFRSIIEQKYPEELGDVPSEVLIQELETNIYGVDSSEEAIDVTIFSLYLAILDYKSAKSLLNIKLPNLKSTNLLINDFLFSDLKHSNLKFDYIFSNPPWGKSSINKSSQISIDFVHEILDQYVKKGSKVTMILPSKILYNNTPKSRKFRNRILSDVMINELVELAPLRQDIFHNATGAAFIISFKYIDEEKQINLRNSFKHITVKMNNYFRFYNILAIEKNDVKSIEQKKLIENDWLWKILVYGSSWDINIMEDLMLNYPTIKEVINRINTERSEDKKIVMKKGIQVNGGDKNDSSQYIGMELLDSRTGVDKFIIDDTKSTLFDKKYIHRPRVKDIFVGPKVLFKKGLNMQDFTLKSVYTERDVLFHEAISTITGYVEDEIFLKALTGLLNSSLYSYLNVMSSSSLGIEREQVHLSEISDYPFFDNEQNMIKVANLVEEIQNLNNNEIKNNGVVYQEKINKLNEEILKAFNLNDNDFVDYALNVTSQQIRGHSSYSSVEKNTMDSYSEIFIKYFEKMFNSQGLYTYSEVNMNFRNHFCIFKLSIVDTPQDRKIRYTSEEQVDLKFITKFSTQAITDSFYRIVDEIVFTDDSFYIIKSKLKDNWHRAIARKDMAEVVDLIMRGA